MTNKNQEHFDIIIIGTGPAGESTASSLTGTGMKIAIIEKYSMVGGGSTHYGTIPSKALRHAIERMQEIETNPLFHHTTTEKHNIIQHIMNSAKRVMTNISQSKSKLYQESNDITLIHGMASFVDCNTIQVLEHDEIKKLTAERIIIATGSHPYHPGNIDFSHPRVFDSDSILNLKEPPTSIIIYGAGVIGCEYASIFAGAGSKIELINTRDRLLSFLDSEISEALSYHMREQNISIKNNEEYDFVNLNNDNVELHLKSGKILKGDIILWANGRTGNAANLNLEAANIHVNNRLQIEVNNHYQTEQSHIYAIGDIIGWPALASAAYGQGRYVAEHIVKQECDIKVDENIPTGIYTIPEISCIGKTEEELTEEKIPYEVGKTNFKNLSRTHIRNQKSGILKILFHRETLQILGIHCFGYQASDIIHIGQAIMAQPGSANTIRYFINTTFNYPTMAEAYKIAALNGLSKIE
ncbi:MAG: Si-specific NAD(P)(+) transhydrogenase [Gammaproteobacteria bacterium]|nr:MAG: Si-specific NAD(P)(+) transhydrogenase [Gammaproteobacteria bacterium]